MRQHCWPKHAEVLLRAMVSDFLGWFGVAILVTLATTMGDGPAATRLSETDTELSMTLLVSVTLKR